MPKKSRVLVVLDKEAEEIHAKITGLQGRLEVIESIRKSVLATPASKRKPKEDKRQLVMPGAGN